MNGYFYETNHWKIVLPTDQRYLGYLIIKTKIERQSLPELTVDEQLDFFSLIAKLESFYKEKCGATMFNYSCLMNNFLPRYRNVASVLGQEFTDPNFGMPYQMEALAGNGQVTVPDEIRAYITQQLIEYLK